MGVYVCAQSIHLSIYPSIISTHSIFLGLQRGESVTTVIGKEAGYIRDRLPIHCKEAKFDAAHGV